MALSPIYFSRQSVYTMFHFLTEMIGCVKSAFSGFSMLHQPVLKDEKTYIEDEREIIYDANSLLGILDL